MFFITLRQHWAQRAILSRKLSKLKTAAAATLCIGAVLSTPIYGNISSGGVWTDSAENLWAEYVQSTPKEKLQSGCLPVKLSPSNGIQATKTLVAYHGFTACPQQFLGVAQNWADLGYEVLLPLLPGHGRNFDKDNNDDLSDMIKRTHWRKYEKFVNQMNTIVEATDGKAVSMGLSLGGTLALHATTLRPELYSKQMIMVPMLELKADTKNDLHTAVVNQFIRTFSLLPRVGKIQYSWDQWGECSTTERDLGRAGICQYQASHLGAALRFARKTMAKTKRLRRSKKIPTQFIGVENDTAISNGAFAKTIRRYQLFNPEAKACFYPKPTNHSLISEYDAPFENKFWLESFNRNTINFLSQGKHFPYDDLFRTKYRFKRCFID